MNGKIYVGVGFNHFQKVNRFFKLSLCVSKVILFLSGQEGLFDILGRSGDVGDKRSR